MKILPGSMYSWLAHSGKRTPPNTLSCNTSKITAVKKASSGHPSKYKHPYQEATEAQRRLLANAAPLYDEFLVLRYRATNEPPYPFEWVDYTDTVQEYGSILTRISRNYEKRF